MNGRCLAKVNVFGFGMNKPCEGEFECWHGPPLGSCALEPAGCRHHEPDWEDFDDWAEQVRRDHERSFLSKV